jgi:hypothetical protein
MRRWISVAALAGCGPEPENPAVQTGSDEALLRLSRENVRLRQRIAALESELKRPEPTGPRIEPAVASGPKNPMTGFIAALGHTFGYAIISVERMHPEDRPKPGFRFEIVRGQTAVGVAEVLKVKAGDPRDLPMLEVKILSDPKEVRVGDSAVAKRSVVVGEPVAEVVGAMGRDVYQVNVGRNRGLNVGDRLFAYRGERLSGVLRVVDLELENCVCRLEAGSGEPGMGDQVRIEHAQFPRRQIHGQIKHLDKTAIIDAGIRAGARPGQLYEVRRRGLKVGNLVVKEVRDYDWSICEPAMGTALSDLQKEDSVELIKD